MSQDSETLVPRMERINLLMDIYGELLTDKQRKFVRLHYSDDLSFGEIAAQFNVSRQAIYDAVKHAIANLERYEKTLHLLGRMKNQNEAESSEQAQSAGELAETAGALKKLRHKIQKQNIIYNVDWIVHDMGDILERLEKLTPDTNQETENNG